MAKYRDHKRRYIPLDIWRSVAQRQGVICACGCGEEWIASKHDLDHDPALCNRPWNDDHSDTIPPANSEAHLVYRIKDHHLGKTKKDVREKTKVDHVVAKGGLRSERKLMADVACLNEMVFKKRKMRNRGFDKTKSKGFDGKVRPRKERRMRNG